MEEWRLRQVKKLTRKEGCLGLNKGPPVSRMSVQRWFPGQAEQHREKLGAEPEGGGGHCPSITSQQPLLSAANHRRDDDIPSGPGRSKGGDG